MKTELLITEKRTGRIWECSNVTEEAKYTTNRTGSPGTFKFTLHKAGDLSFVEGDVVRFSVDGRLIFYGWVFNKSKDRWGKIDVTCYDRLRYLKANASYYFNGQTASQIINQIAADLQLETGTIADTGYIIPTLIKQNQSCLDTIEEALNQTLLNTGKVYVLYDDGTGLALKEAKDMMGTVMIGDKSLLTDYTYTTDIDTQTYNSVKLVLQNESSGTGEAYVVQDSENIAKWGLLQYYQTVDGDMNAAQVLAQAKASLEYYNRRLRTLKVTALGVLGLRAGQMVLMQIKGLGDIDLDRYVLIDRITHTFKNDVHTMDVELFSI